jgi:xanthine/CO dehydrogenase XdhC/CoxF family maturation factor
VGLVSGGWIEEDAEATLREVVKSGSAEARAALARARELRPAILVTEAGGYKLVP